MKNSIFNSVMIAVAFSVALGLSSQAAAEQSPDKSATDGWSSEQVQFGTIRPLDASKTESVIVAGLIVAIEEQDVEVNIQAQNRAEAMYQRHSGSGSFFALPPGHAYQSVAIAF